MAKTSNALKIIDKIVGDVPKLRDLITKETINAKVANMIYQARNEAGLSQAELAKRVGTSQPVIARLENADYQGHSLSMLRRVADALEKGLEIGWTSRKRKTPTKAKKRSRQKRARVTV